MSNICDEIVKDVGCEIKEMVKETKFDGLERGFIICFDPLTSQYYSALKCVGSECGVDIRGVCGEGREYGIFHTHPTVSNGYYMHLSREDIEVALNNDYDVMCVGLPNSVLSCVSFDRSSPYYYKLKELFEDRDFVTRRIRYLSEEIDYYMERGMSSVVDELEDEMSEYVSKLSRTDEEIWRTLPKVASHCEVRI